MSHWFQAKVVSSRPAADGLTAVHLDVSGTPVAGTHALPGQYVKLSLEGKGEAYFAIASGPGAAGEHFEFLVKSGSPLSDALRSAPVGQSVQVSPVAGKGFPLQKARGHNLLLFATGSGISAIRSTLYAIFSEREAYGQVTLFFGVRTPSAFAYAEELCVWEHHRVRVVRTVSQPGQSGWTELTGYVQSHLEDVPTEDAVAFVCGQKAMVHGVTEALAAKGVPKERIFLNF